MPQENKLDPHFPASVAEIIETGFISRKRQKTVDDLLKLLKIEGLKFKSFPDLSGGQRQKVLLARALAASEKLLLLDEPSNNLDQKSRQELYRILKTLNKHGLTIMMITHDLDHDSLLGNKILSLPSNFFGATADYIERVHHA